MDIGQAKRRISFSVQHDLKFIQFILISFLLFFRHNSDLIPIRFDIQRYMAFSISAQSKWSYWNDWLSDTHLWLPENAPSFIEKKNISFKFNLRRTAALRTAIWLYNQKQATEPN